MTHEEPRLTAGIAAGQTGSCRGGAAGIRTPGLLIAKAWMPLTVVFGVLRLMGIWMHGRPPQPGRGHVGGTRQVAVLEPGADAGLRSPRTVPRGMVTGCDAGTEGESTGLTRLVAGMGTAGAYGSQARASRCCPQRSRWR